jgi:hypothetical protein
MPTEKPASCPTCGSDDPRYALTNEGEDAMPGAEHGWCDDGWHDREKE